MQKGNSLYLTDLSGWRGNVAWRARAPQPRRFLVTNVEKGRNSTDFYAFLTSLRQGRVPIGPRARACTNPCIGMYWFLPRRESVALLCSTSSARFPLAYVVQMRRKSRSAISAICLQRYGTTERVKKSSRFGYGRSPNKKQPSQFLQPQRYLHFSSISYIPFLSFHGSSWEGSADVPHY